MHSCAKSIYAKAAPIYIPDKKAPQVVGAMQMGAGYYPLEGGLARQKRKNKKRIMSKLYLTDLKESADGLIPRANRN
ncbi:hypothetical protein [Cellvibrio sp. UBA7661]|uniref:hypothetical protein n=1 Tax=Cellvibrio sp. UBA7661 TaxID=1946311 RepID=UPI002F350215